MAKKKSFGVYGNYIIAKADGSFIDDKAKYFVLRYDEDPYAMFALEQYVEAIRETMPFIAADLENELGLMKERAK
jgi:hypothetical protein